jgi:hypothetical protein
MTVHESIFAAPENSRLILICCQKGILNFSYSKNTKQPRNIFPFIKLEPDIHYHPCLAHTLGLALAFRQRRNAGLVEDTLLVSLYGGTNTET